MNDLVITTSDGKDVTTSLKVTEVFNKNHRDVLRSIGNLECSSEFRERNYARSSYMSEQGKKMLMYNITKDGFTFLAMGFRGEKAAKFKEDYINEFNHRGEELKRIQLEQKRLMEIELSLFWNKEDRDDIYKRR